jgi:hypothetical protein
MVGAFSAKPNKSHLPQVSSKDRVLLSSQSVKITPVIEDKGYGSKTSDCCSLYTKWFEKAEAAFNFFKSQT